MDRRTLLRSVAVALPTLGAGCSLRQEAALTDLDVEVRNTTDEPHDVAVSLEFRGDVVFARSVTVAPNEVRSLDTDVTSHPLTVRATVDGSLEDLDSYVWHGCREDAISVDVEPEPAITSGCYDD